MGFSKKFSKMLKPTEPTSAERSSAEVFVTGGNASPDAPACDAVFAGFPLFSGGSPFPEGRVRRLIVTMPPQHGKSVGATTLLPAYVLGLDPDCRVAIASYSGTLASKFNRRVQRILESQEYAAFFPDTSIKRGAKPPGYIRTADEVEIIGRRGGLLSVGREGSLTGNCVDCFVLDDLYT